MGHDLDLTFANMANDHSKKLKLEEQKRQKEQELIDKSTTSMRNTDRKTSEDTHAYYNANKLRKSKGKATMFIAAFITVGLACGAAGYSMNNTGKTPEGINNVQVSVSTHAELVDEAKTAPLSLLYEDEFYKSLASKSKKNLEALCKEALTYKHSKGTSPSDKINLVIKFAESNTFSTEGQLHFSYGDTRNELAEISYLSFVEEKPTK